MLGCLEDEYLLIFQLDWERKTIQIYHQHTNYRNKANIWAQYLSHLFSKLHKKILARVAPNGDPTATPLISINNLLLNIKCDSLVATASKWRKTSLGILGVFSSSLYKLSMQISMVLSSGILVNKESTSRLAKYKLGSCLQISSAIWNVSITVDLFWVESVKHCSKYFASL